MTPSEASQQLRNRLKTIYNDDESAVITEWVFEHITSMKRTDRLKTREKPLATEQETLLKEYTERLLSHEPVQYILNEAWFCGLKLYVDKNVLIPRPETEELVEWIIADCKFPVDTLKILDIGSGSGCIPIALKRRIRKAEVWSCELSESALQVARQNAANLGTEVNFLLLDFLEKTKRAQLPFFNIIVSNPPYIPEKDRSQLQPNVVQYEPHTALFVPDEDPLIFYKAIADFGLDHLAKNGKIYLEIHEDLGQYIGHLFRSKGYSIEIKKDMQGKETMLKASPSHSS